MPNILHQKESIKVITDLFASICGFSLYSLIPSFVESGISFSSIKNFVDIVQLIAGIVGVVYLIVRIVDLYYSVVNKKISNSIDNRIKMEELKKIERENFPGKWNDEFIKNR